MLQNVGTKLTFLAYSFPERVDHFFSSSAKIMVEVFDELDDPDISFLSVFALLSDRVKSVFRKSRYLTIATIPDIDDKSNNTANNRSSQCRQFTKRIENDGS